MEAIGQTYMRSESEGHFYPIDFPGFALMDALHRISPAPLVRSVFNRYTPSVESVLAHGAALCRHLDMQSRIETVEVARVSREEEPEPHFALRDATDQVRARARHVLLAPGHAGLRWPDVCRDPQLRDALSGLVYHAYQPKCYQGRDTVVIGAGLAAVTEWLNVLRSGGTVLSVRRSARLVEQPLSAPRCAFVAPWLDWYHALEPVERMAALRQAGQASFRMGPGWRREIKRARLAGRLELSVGEVVGLERGGDGSVAARIREAETGESRTVTAGMVVAATGFISDWDRYGVLERLVGEYGLATRAGYLVLVDDCSVPDLSRPDSVLMLSGPTARWAYPAADSFAGMKYAARRFSARVLRCERLGPRPRSWFKLVRGGWPYGHAGRPRSEPCASP
jgi:hypothetical protein